MRIRDVLAFVLLATALAWSFWLAAMALPSDGTNESIRALLFLPGTFAPAFAALLLTARRHGAAGLASIGERLLKWNVPGRFYAFAVFYMIAVRLAAAGVHRLVIGAWPAMWEQPLYVMLGAALLSTPFQAGEEIGWRGYALPRLSARFGLAAASVIVGVIWAVWHLPLFFAGGAGRPGDSFPVFVIAATALSVPMAWLYWKTGGSLLLVMLMHAVSNNTRGILVRPIESETATFSLVASPVAWLIVIILWIGAAVLLVQMRHTNEITLDSPATT